jgi:DnaJ-class molecular chaperone
MIDKPKVGPFERECPKCGGTGYFEPESQAPGLGKMMAPPNCPRCGGKGTIPKAQAD